MNLLHGDCMELLKDIPTESVDLILTDPPYGMTANEWDKVLPLDEMFAQFNRIIKPDGCMAIFTQQPFLTDLINANRKYFRYEWVWYKHLSTGFLNANKMPLKVHENIAIFYKHLPTYNPQFTWGKPYSTKSRGNSLNYGKFNSTATINEDGRRYPVDIVDITQARGFIGNSADSHPTQKPTELCEYLICTYTNEGDTVLDPCMGSGTTGVACVNTGREFTGMELDDYYFTKASERLEKARQAKESQPCFLIPRTDPKS